jgi:DNA mismatch repair protein MutH
LEIYLRQVIAAQIPLSERSIGSPISISIRHDYRRRIGVCYDDLRSYPTTVSLQLFL